jgi:hypothetical protein
MSQCHGFATSSPFVRSHKGRSPFRFTIFGFLVLAALVLMPLSSLHACEALQPLYEPVDVLHIQTDGVIVTRGGERLRLASVWTDGAAGHAAIDILRVAQAGSVLEAAIVGDMDRWGRRPADLILHLADGSTEAFPDDGIAAGAFFVWPSLEDNDPCLSERINLETAARRARRGIWADPAIVIDGTTLALTENAIGRPALARGRVESVVFRRSAAYVNFGRTWRNRLSVVVPIPKLKARRETLMSAIRALAGRTVLIRGIIEAGRDAPRMLITDERQISIEDGQGQ